MRTTFLVPPPILSLRARGRNDPQANGCHPRTRQHTPRGRESHASRVRIAPMKPTPRGSSLNCRARSTGRSNAVAISMSSNHRNPGQEGSSCAKTPVLSARGILLGVSALFLSLCAAGAQGTFEPITITFDGPPLQPPGSSYQIQSYSEAGVWFAPMPGTDGFGRNGAGIAMFPENGTAYLQAALGDSLMFGLDDGSSFDPVSVDLAEYSTVVPDAVTVPFVGYRRDGGTVTTSFTTDGIMDGTGPLADFQTFNFPPAFSGVYRVEIPAFGWSLDNLRLYVPEPGTGTLLGLGAALLGVHYLRRKRHS